MYVGERGFDSLSADAEVDRIVTYLIMAAILLLTIVNGLFIVHSCIFGALHAYRKHQQDEARKRWLEQRKPIVIELQRNSNNNFVLQSKDDSSHDVLNDQDSDSLRPIEEE